MMAHVLRRALRSLWENLSLNLVATGVIAAATLLAGVYLAVMINLTSVVDSWDRDVHISAYFFDDVPVGAPCTFDDYFYCAEVNGRLLGTCDVPPGSTVDLRCYAWCRLDPGPELESDCPVDQVCTDTGWGDNLGVCTAGS